MPLPASANIVRLTGTNLCPPPFDRVAFHRSAPFTPPCTGETARLIDTLRVRAAPCRPFHDCPLELHRVLARFAGGFPAICENDGGVQIETIRPPIDSLLSIFLSAGDVQRITRRKRHSAGRRVLAMLGIH